MFEKNILDKNEVREDASNLSLNKIELKPHRDGIGHIFGTAVKIPLVIHQGPLLSYKPNFFDSHVSSSSSAVLDGLEVIRKPERIDYSTQPKLKGMTGNFADIARRSGPGFYKGFRVGPHGVCEISEEEASVLAKMNANS